MLLSGYKVKSEDADTVKTITAETTISMTKQPVATATAVIVVKKMM